MIQLIKRKEITNMQNKIKYKYDDYKCNTTKYQ